MKQIKKNKKLLGLLFLTIIFLGFFLRFYNLNLDNFWVDEIFSFWVADPSISLKETYLRNNQIEIVPILFNLILKIFFQIFGYDIHLARYVPLFFGVLSIIFVSKLYREITKNKNDLLITFLLSFNIFLISYSQELRVYTLLFFLVTINLIYFNKIVETNKKNISSIIIFIVINFLSILAHQFSLIVIFSYIVFIIITYLKYNKTFKNLNISISILIVFSLIYLYIFYKNQVNFMFWINAIDIKFFTNLYFSKFFGSRLVGGLHLLLFFYLIFLNWRNFFLEFNVKLILFIIVFFSYFLPIIYGYIFHPIINARYIIFVLIPILIIICDLIYKLKSAKIKKILIFLICAITIGNHFTEASFRQFFEQRRTYKPDFNGAINEIKKSGNFNIFLKVDRGDLKVSNPVEPQIEALENYVSYLSKKNKVNLNIINNNSFTKHKNFWVICVFDLNPNKNCKKPKKITSYKIVKNLDLNRLNIKYFEKEN
jgi:uncharacterized membrane protein